MSARPHTGGAPLSRGRGSGRVRGYSTEQSTTEELSTSDRSAVQNNREGNLGIDEDDVAFDEGLAWESFEGYSTDEDRSGGVEGEWEGDEAHEARAESGEGWESEEREGESERDVLGAPLSREEVERLVAECLKEKRQVNLGKDQTVAPDFLCTSYPTVREHYCVFVAVRQREMTSQCGQGLGHWSLHVSFHHACVLLREHHHCSCHTRTVSLATLSFILLTMYTCYAYCERTPTCCHTAPPCWPLGTLCNV